MSDPLSIAASVAGLITISAQIVGMTKELFDKVKDAPETMMKVREEVESMQPIFCQVHLLLNGSGSGLNRGNLTMISIHNLMATLTGCVIVYSKLEKKVNEVCGFNDLTASWRRAGVIADRVKWGLWRHEEVLVIIEDLQRQKLSLNLMLTILSYKSSACVAVLRLLVQIAFGTNYGDDNRSSGRSMMRAAIDMGYDLAVRAIIHLEPRVVVEVDTEGLTPFAYAYYLQRNEICEMLLQSLKADREIATEVVKSEGNFAGRVHAVIEQKCLLLLRLQLLFATSMDVDKIGAEGQTPLTHGIEVFLNSDDINYKAWNDIFKTLLGKASTANLESVKKIKAKAAARQFIATSMHGLVQKDYKSILVLLSWTGSRDAEGWTPLASAVFNFNEALYGFLLENGCSICLDVEQKEQLKPKLSCRIIDAARGGHEASLQLLLDMGANINERNAGGETAMVGAVYYNHLSCVKILVERGADATILQNYGYSVLHYAALTSTNSEMMMFLLDVVETRKLVDMKSSNGDIALHDCSYSDHYSPIVRLENAKMLVQAGASLTIKNNDGRTPYEYARYLNRKELTKYLWSQLSPKQQAQGNPPTFTLVRE